MSVGDIACASDNGKKPRGGAPDPTMAGRARATARPECPPDDPETT
jgi:hypothetical protein